MVWLVMVLWCICLGTFLFTRGYCKGQWSGLEKKVHPLSKLYPTCYFIYKKFGLNRCLQKENRVRIAMNSIAAKGLERLELELFFLKRLSACFLCFFCMLSLLFVFELSKMTSSNQNNLQVVRRPASKVEPPTYRTILVDSEYEDIISFQIAPKQEEPVSNASIVQNERIKKKYEEGVKRIHEVLLGANPELSFVGRPLVLINELQEEMIKISWETSDDTIISTDGMVHNEELKEAAKVIIRATMMEDDETVLGNFELMLNVIPKREFEYQMWKEELIAKIEQDEEGEEVYLPDSYKGHKIRWGVADDRTGINVLIFAVILCTALYIAMNERLILEVQKRKEQMVVDYPGIVNKLALLISAGMTVTGAWQRIVEDYERLSKVHKKPRYAYEQMKLTAQEMRLGVSEAVAFNEFGQRCMSVEYMKLANVLVQNLRKGADGIVQTLSVMSSEAFEQRKNRARQIGEKAGTKLLFPMLIMLVLVLVIIMVPAFWSMKI